MAHVQRVYLNALTNCRREEGVIQVAAGDESFETIYLEARRRENRIYSDDEVRRLPFVATSDPHYREWRVRASSLFSFQQHLLRKNSPLTVLDLGSGNGWFAAKLAKSTRHRFYCMDVNLRDLQQGARVFAGNGIEFLCGNVFAAELAPASFDLVVLNGSVQYFAELRKLVERLLPLLRTDGEIHFIDSPFYPEETVAAARQRTVQYYTALGVPEMIGLYHHHCLEDLKQLGAVFLHNPNGWWQRCKWLIGCRVPPFPWVLIQKLQSR